MLGLISRYKGTDIPEFHVTNDGQRFNLQPWPVVGKDRPTMANPSGVVIIPAATQEDFARFLKENPDMKNIIGELNPQDAKQWQDAYDYHNKKSQAAQPQSSNK